MHASQFLKTRVPTATKALVRAAAERELVTESIWFRRAIDRALRVMDGGGELVRPFADQRVSDGRPPSAGTRLYVRLQPDDQLLLRERAIVRGMPTATYASVLLRAHLRDLAPIPKEELLALKRTIAELGAMGRNLNQIARAANQGDRSARPTTEDLRLLVKVCEALRDHVRELLKANAESWRRGHAEP